MVMKLGTILPTKESLARDDAFADSQMSKAKRKAAKKYAGLGHRIVGGETRYYKTSTVYTVVAIDGRERWFETRSDGDYAI